MAQWILFNALDEREPPNSPESRVFVQLMVDERDWKRDLRELRRDDYKRGGFDGKYIGNGITKGRLLASSDDPQLAASWAADSTALGFGTFPFGVVLYRVGLEGSHFDHLGHSYRKGRHGDQFGNLGQWMPVAPYGGQTAMTGLEASMVARDLIRSG